MTEETPLRLTEHELIALLSMNMTRAAETTAGIFRLGHLAGNELLEQAGITTLLVRGLARIDGDDIVPLDRGSIVAGMLPLGVQLARHYLESGAEGYPAAAMFKRHRASGPPLTAHLKVDQDGPWTLATGEDGADKAEMLDSADGIRRFEDALTF